MKADNKALLRDRARKALSNLYHNATPTYPDFRNDFEADQFQSWFDDHAQFEIEYIQGGGAYGSRRLKPNHAVKRAQYAQWEKIGNYGRLYTYGRGGRTLAPEKLIKTGGGSSFRINEEILDDLDSASLTELVLILESFNKVVGDWNRSIPEVWKEEKKQTGLNRIIWRYDGKRRVSVRRYVS